MGVKVQRGVGWGGGVREGTRREGRGGGGGGGGEGERVWVCVCV